MSSPSRSERIPTIKILLACLFGLSLIQGLSAVAVMSVDLGSEWMKVAVVTVSKSRFSHIFNSHFDEIFLWL